MDVRLTRYLLRYRGMQKYKEELEVLIKGKQDTHAEHMFFLHEMDEISGRSRPLARPM